MRRPPLRRVLIASLLFSVHPSVAADAPTSERPDLHPVETVEIVGSATVPGLGQPLDRLPVNVQELDADRLRRLGAASVSDALGRAAAGVHVGGTEENPFEPDLFYRGFESSGLLGTPQGLSVFADGVRVNEFLGDVVNWGLVPQDALRSIEIVPGSNPLYGRNTLGGAVALDTKRGFTDPGSEIDAYGGSFGRRRVMAETGGSHGAFDYFAMANLFREDGFRDFSKSAVNQLFTEVGWRRSDTDLRLTYTAVHDELHGNSSAPESLIAEDRDAVYTQPDVSRPDLHFVHLTAARSLRASLKLDGGFYWRTLVLRRSNADAAGDAMGSTESLPGVLRFSKSDETRYGGRAGLRYGERLFGAENDAAIGVEVDRGSGAFSLAEQAGVIDADRSVVATGPSALRTNVDTSATSVGVYATDTFTPASWVSFTPSLRYDRTTLSIEDRLGGAASGSHEFARLDPAIGVTVRPTAAASVFASYAESFRAPTAIELTCASESAPCPLPVAFSEDPPLKKVRARTVEVGVRSTPFPAVRATVAAFRTDLDDDILFVSRSRSVGFFRNVGTTRRQGVEALLDGKLEPLGWFVNYSFTRPTFETSETLPSPVGENAVKPGDIIPGVPDHLLRAGVDGPLPAGLRFALEIAYTGRQFLRTDEANQTPPLSSYVLLNARLEWRRGPLSIYARAENLLDREYETAGSRGANVFAGGRVERFVSPGAPLGGWFGVMLDL
jgi:iron complex outermembrane receptor protein